MTDQGGPTVLVITRELDLTADYVITRLNARGVLIVRFDLADFPTTVEIRAEHGQDGWSGVLAVRERRVSLEEIEAVWYRKPTDFGFPSAQTEVERVWSAREAKAGFGGLLLAGLRCRWINHPHHNAAATKPDQLLTAARCGLRTPDTLLTNSAEAARQFCDQHPAGVVYKSLCGAPFSEAGQVVALFTTPVTAAQITDQVRWTMHQFQADVPKKFEARVTVVNGQIFGVRIDAHTDAGRQDWRADHDHLSWTEVDVPADVANGVRLLMNTYGLVFGALDFIIDRDDRWWFLEINPNGQWAWNHPYRDRIADALADALATPERITT